MSLCKDYGTSTCDRLVKSGDRIGSFHDIQMCNSGRLERCRKIEGDKTASRPIDCGEGISIAAALLGPGHEKLLEKGEDRKTTGGEGKRNPCDGTCPGDGC